MSRRGLLVLLVVLGLLAAGAAVVGATAPDHASVRSHRGWGQRLLWTYLQARGVPTVSWERPLGELPTDAPDGVLVISTPLRAPFTRADADALDRWRTAGGAVVVATSGQGPERAEAALLRALGWRTTEVRGAAPLGPGAWWDWAHAESTLVPLDPAPDAPALAHALTGAGWQPRVWAPTAAPMPLDQSEPVPGIVPLFRDAEGQALIVLDTRAPGPLVVLGSSTLMANQFLARADNLALVEATLTSLAAGGTVYFDEVHQGHLAPGPGDPPSPAGPLQAVVAHAGLLWLLGLWMLSRRHGSPVPQAALAPRPGALTRDLVALADLHRQAGHSATAAARMRHLAARQLARTGSGGAPLSLPPAGGDDAALLALAQAVADAQAPRTGPLR